MLPMTTVKGITQYESSNMIRYKEKRRSLIGKVDSYNATKNYGTRDCTARYKTFIHIILFM